MTATEGKKFVENRAGWENSSHTIFDYGFYCLSGPEPNTEVLVLPMGLLRSEVAESSKPPNYCPRPLIVKLSYALLYVL